MKDFRTKVPGAYVDEGVVVGKKNNVDIEEGLISPKPNTGIVINTATGKTLKGASQKTYGIKGMEPEYMPGGTKSEFEKGVKRITEAEKHEYLLYIDESGKATNYKGGIADTSISQFVDDGIVTPTNRAIFVMTESGEILMSVYQQTGLFHHSSLAGGQPVASAGLIVIENGVIKMINNQSGHYKCSFEMLENIKIELQSRGVDVTKIEFKDVLSE